MNAFLENLNVVLTRDGHRRPWLAEKSGVGLSTINNWFAYDRWPALDMAYAVAKTVGVSIEELMGEEPLAPKSRLFSGVRGELVDLVAGLPGYLVTEFLELARAAVRAVEKERRVAFALSGTGEVVEKV
jgi:transcriptional regulator with XRE-family HTH domain